MAIQTKIDKANLYKTSRTQLISPSTWKFEISDIFIW